ncbi:MAG: helix-turn-helix transcriptional regulator [Candidatus Eremiobacteraeota bacterium]|nr:helix-turn-helix transcriptional regulator [Candidatus Eremiobacteraeota bacterium]
MNNWLQQARDEKDLKQAQLAEKTAISKQRICKIEKGLVLPTRAQSEVLAKELGLGGVPCSDDLLPDREFQSLRRHRPYELEVHNQERWKVALKAWGARIFRLKLDPRILGWMRLLIRVDSALEALFWMLLAAAKAGVFLANPHAMGFRLHPIVDSQGFCLGERCLPGLYLESGNRKIWIWPQVNLRPKDIAYRVDALVLIVEGENRRWMVLELDGRGHNPAQDGFRRDQLGMSEIRITEAEIKEGNPAQRLLAA